MTPHDYLRLHPFLGALTNGEVDELLRSVRTKRVGAGDVRFRKDDRTSTLQVTQRDLALMLGVSREFVSRLLTLWRKGGIVAIRRRRLTVLDAAALERPVQGCRTG